MEKINIEVSEELARVIINALDSDNIDLMKSNEYLKDENTKLYQDNTKLNTELENLKERQGKFESTCKDNQKLNKIVKELMDKDDKNFKEIQKLKKENEKLKIKYETCNAIREIKGEQ